MELDEEEHGAPRRPVVLIILDGFGGNPNKADNAVILADTPRLDEYFSRYSHTLISASGRAVGLPDGQMGNSEVGHIIMGCGALVRQDLVHIDDEIENRAFFSNEVLLAAADAAAAAQRPIHLMGLVSDGGVHSHVRHLLALIRLCHKRGARPLLHMITDGRDTPPRSARDYLPDVAAALERAGGAIATVSGRYYAMDRDNRWGRTESAWTAMVENEGRRAESAREAIETSYAEGQDDEFIVPTVLPDALPFEAGEQAIFFNFRKDRPRQLVSALIRDDFEHFDRGDFAPITVTCFGEYDQWFNMPYAFHREKPQVTLSDVISHNGLRQFHCAETEKYAHVTYFFNGGRSDTLPGEKHQIVPSPKVATYDLKPEMSAPEVADAVIEAINRERYAFIVVNFANGDMVGHTAVREAIIEAVEVLDREAGRVMDAAAAKDYSVILTADHGNCDEMIDPATGGAQTQHTVYPVPCLIVDKQPWRLSSQGGLANISPTVLHLMGLAKPDEMTAKSLLLQPLKG